MFGLSGKGIDSSGSGILNAPSSPAAPRKWNALPGVDPATIKAAVDVVRTIQPIATPSAGSQPFRKGRYLQPDVQRMDAGTGESYNPANPFDRMQPLVRQAKDTLFRRLAPVIDYAPAPPIVSPIVSPITQPLTTTGGGGGGGGAGGGGDLPQPEPPRGFWASLPTAGKVALVGGGALLVGFVGWKLFKRGGGAGPSHKSRS